MCVSWLNFKSFAETSTGGPDKPPVFIDFKAPWSLNIHVRAMQGDESAG